ncbi:MAG: dinitrogenase iron-molybdenum cofactor biosynthesis protein [Clostridia bacterium]|nr:dinitrogenase iron-molybdenum cofactor biosynthesis protein [Clostridia bacterium]
MSKVAIASTDGINVNEHFGRAAFFRVYELSENGHHFVEVRDAVAACQQKRVHNKTNFDLTLDMLSDCDAILVSRIGEGAAAYIISKGIRVFEVSGNIDAVLEKLILDKVFAA